MQDRVRLWQVERETFNQSLIVKDPYFTFARPPMVFSPEGFNGHILIYYKESFNYGFGGDSSRPKYSFIRIYNDTYPEGKDIAQFGFKAGTIVNLEWKESSVFVTGDRSRPSQSEKPRLPVRVWKIDFL